MPAILGIDARIERALEVFNKRDSLYIGAGMSYGHNWPIIDNKEEPENPIWNQREIVDLQFLKKIPPSNVFLAVPDENSVDFTINGINFRNVAEADAYIENAVHLIISVSFNITDNLPFIEYRQLGIVHEPIASDGTIFDYEFYLTPPTGVDLISQGQLIYIDNHYPVQRKFNSIEFIDIIIQF